MDGKTMGKFQALFEATPPNIEGLVFFSPHNAHKVLTNENANKILRGLLKELREEDTKNAVDRFEQMDNV
ncbi:hypothetical protein [Rossellomorea marisflavi]|uniref:hypothetical protein n=1 Tax=Rossellomorea marisflavi TaxID=189381 RepID=UPI0030800EEF